MWSTELERLDVAIRAVWWLAVHARWDLLEDLGVSLPGFRKDFERAEDEMNRPRTDKEVFRFLKLCPTAFPAALELNRRYLALHGLERLLFYTATQKRGA